AVPDHLEPSRRNRVELSNGIGLAVPDGNQAIRDTPDQPLDLSIARLTFGIVTPVKRMHVLDTSHEQLARDAVHQPVHVVRVDELERARADQAAQLPPREAID